MKKTFLSMEKSLKKQVRATLLSQGYSIKKHVFSLSCVKREELRKIHQLPRTDKMIKNIHFIEKWKSKAMEFMKNSFEIDIKKINPTLIQIKEGSLDANLFRWWNLVWWSLPYEKPYGRQMRFLVWDTFHNAPIGLIGLQSPILKWNVRDQYLKITPEVRDTLINQSMSAQRLGALPPYNKFLCGKLVASLMLSNHIREAFNKKYKHYKTIIKNRNLPSKLLFITTTGAYGKSSVYNRLADEHGKISEFIGWTNGSGSFHIPDNIYEKFIYYLRQKGRTAKRAFGNGPSVKMKNISQAMALLGFQNGSHHGIKRAVYLFRFAKNLDNIIQQGKRPLWYNRDVEDLTDQWRKRWAIKRDPLYCSEEKLYFSKKEFIANVEQDILKCKKLMKNHLINNTIK